MLFQTSPFLDLLQAMKSCLAIIKAFPFLLDVVYNIKEWLSPHAEELHAHTQPKSFKFVRDEEGHCVMYYRNYSHMKWEGPQRLLKVHKVYGTIIIIVLTSAIKVNFKGQEEEVNNKSNNNNNNNNNYYYYIIIIIIIHNDFVLQKTRTIRI